MSTFTHGHALLVGVGADLPNTVDDAKGLAGILADPERCAYPSDHVVAVTDAAATRAGVLGALDALAAHSDANSTVVVFFSGHGYQVTSSTGEQYYLMPNGYDLNALFKTAISGKEFADKLKTVPAQKMLVLLDCCHAGGIGEEKSPGLSLSKSPLPPEANSLFAKGAGRVLIASSRADEKSFAGRPYSAFTLALVEALSGVGAAKSDGYVRWTDLALHAREKVPQRTANRQHPIIDLEQADNFVLAYYSGGSSQPKGLPFAAPPEIEPEPGAFRNVTNVQGGQVNIETMTGGFLQPGWTVSGPVNQAGRDMVNAQGSQGFVNQPAGPVTQHFGNRVDTSGGAYVGGAVTIGSGDFVGRDKVVHGDETHGDKVGGDKISVGNVSGTGIAIGSGARAQVQKGLSGTDLDRVFAPLTAVVNAAPPSARAEATQKVQELKSEVAKGEKADDTRIAMLIDGLVGLVPAGVSAVASIFATPGPAGLAGNATKFVLDKIKGN